MNKQESLKKFSSNKKPLFKSTSLLESQTTAFKMFDQISEKSQSPEKPKTRASMQVNGSLNEVNSKHSSTNTTIVEKVSPKKEASHRTSVSMPVITLSKDINSKNPNTSSTKNLGNASRNSLKSPDSVKQSDKKLILDSLSQKKSVARSSIFELGAEKRRESSINIPTAIIYGSTSQTNLDTSQNSQNNLSSQIQASIGASKSSNIKVVVRFRPLNTVEKDFISSNIGFITCEFPQKEDGSVVIKSDPQSNSASTTSVFKYDKVFNLDTSQIQMYDFIGRETLQDVCNGYNGTIFTYGQSGSGKTFTMYGNDIFDELNKGLIPRVIDHLFQIVEESGEDSVFQLKFSIMQIYKEIVYDLLTGEKDLKVKESPTKGIYVEGLSEFYIDNTESFLELLQMSQEQRVVSGTKLNQYSSRSHTIFVLEVTQTLTKHNITKRGILNLVDLAGTEKVSKTGAVGETLEEAKKINLSLSALGNVIHSLTSGSDHIPYRDSKLTRILQESLGGNYKTTLIVACSPHSYHLEETISTLKFAQRAKTIKNKIKMNVKLSYEELQKIIANLRTELEVASKEIFCLKDILKGSDNMGENIVNLLEAQNVKNSIQSEIVSAELRLLEVGVDSNALTVNNPESGSNINIVNNNSASSVNIFLPSSNSKEIEAQMRRMSLFNRRSSFIDSTVRNNIKNLLGDKFKGVEGDFTNSSSSGAISNSRSKSSKSSKSSRSSRRKSGTSLKSSLSPSDSDSKSSHSKTSMAKTQKSRVRSDSEESVVSAESCKTKSKKKKVTFHLPSKNKRKHNDKRIKELEEKLKLLEVDNSKKKAMIKENNKDLLTACRDLYDRLAKDLKISNKENLNYNRLGSLVSNFENMNNKEDFNFNKEREIKENPIEIPNLELPSLSENVKNTLSAFEKIVKVFSNEIDFDNKRVLNSTFSLEKLKATMTSNTLEGEEKVISSLLPDEGEIKHNILNSDFMKNLQYKLNMELMEIYNINLTNQNKIVNSQNEIMLNLLTDMMTMNQKLLQRVDSNEKPEVAMPRIDERRRSIMPLNANRIAKFVTKKNVEMNRAASNKRGSMDYGMLVTLKHFQNNKNIWENSHFNDNEENDNMSDTNSIYNPMGGGTMHKSLDRCQEQLNTLKEFILKSFKEAQKTKSTFDTLLADIKLIGTVSDACSKPGKVPFSSFRMNEVENTAAVRDVEDTAQSIIKTLQNQNSPGRKNKKNSLPKLSLLEEIDESDEFKLTPTNKIKEKTKLFSAPQIKPLKLDSNISTSSFSKEFENPPDSREDPERNNTVFIVSQSKNSLERMFNKYSSTGSASK
jgi:hypothetical protein